MEESIQSILVQSAYSHLIPTDLFGLSQEGYDYLIQSKFFEGYTHPTLVAQQVDAVRKLSGLVPGVQPYKFMSLVQKIINFLNEVDRFLTAKKRSDELGIEIPTLAELADRHDLREKLGPNLYVALIDYGKNVSLLEVSTEDSGFRSPAFFAQQLEQDLGIQGVLNAARIGAIANTHLSALMSAIMEEMGRIQIAIDNASFAKATQSGNAKPGKPVVVALDGERTLNSSVNPIGDFVLYLEGYLSLSNPKLADLRTMAQLAQACVEYSAQIGKGFNPADLALSQRVADAAKTLASEGADDVHMPNVMASGPNLEKVRDAKGVLSSYVTWLKGRI